MKRSVKARSGSLYFFIMISLILVMWVVAANPAAEAFPMTGTADPPAGGTVVANPPQAQGQGTVVFTATANEGWYIDEVVVDGFTVFLQSLPLSYSNPANRPTTWYEYTITGTIDQSHSMTAYFVQYYDLFSWVATAGGSISPDDFFPVVKGENQTYTITPFPGFERLDVTVNGASQGPVPSVVLTNITQDYEIIAFFRPLGHIITASANDGGTISPEGQVAVAHLGSQTFTIMPNPGSRISRIEVDGVPLAGEMPPQGGVQVPFNNVTSNHTIEAFFEDAGHIITASANAGGTISPSGQVAVAHLGSQTFTIMPNPGSRISRIEVDGVPLAGELPPQGGGQYGFTGVTSDRTIEAFFEDAGHIITASANAGGTISPSGQVSVPHLGSQTFTIQPINSCYRIKSVVVDGVPLEGLPTQGGAGGTYPFTSVDRDHTIVATFEPLGPYTITVNTNGNGTVSPMQGGGVFGPGAGQFQVQVLCGGGWIFTIAPDGAFRIGDVKVDGGSVVVEEELAFSNVQKNYTVDITFEPIYLTIDPGVQGDGTINPQEPAILPPGSSLACTITPASCQRVADILVDGASVMDSDALMLTPTSSGSMRRSSPMAMEYPRPDILATGDSVIYPLTGTDTLTFDLVTGVFIYTFNDIASDHTIVPIFMEMDFTIFTMADGPATIVPIGEIDIPCAGADEIQIGYTVLSATTFIANGYITIDNTLDASLLWDAPDLVLTPHHESEEKFILDIEIASVLPPSEPTIVPVEFAIEIHPDWILDGVLVDDSPVEATQLYDYDPATGFFFLNDLVFSEKIELTFAPSFHIVTSWITPGYDIDTAAIPYLIVAAPEQVEDGGSVSLRIEEALAEASCYDFELRITPEGGETVVVPKADLIMGNQADMVNQVNVYTYPINNIRTDYTAELVYTRTTITIDIQTNDGGLVGPTPDGGTIGPEAGELQVDISCGGVPWQLEITPDDCYKIGNVEVAREGGERVSIIDLVVVDASGKGTFTLADIQNHVSVWVTFEKLGSFTVTTSLKSEDGSPAPVDSSLYRISPDGETKVECGDSFVLDITELDVLCYDFKLIITAEGGEPLVVDKFDIPFVFIAPTDPAYESLVHEYQYELSDIRTNYTMEFVYNVRNVSLMTRIWPGNDGVEHGSILPGYYGDTVTCGEKIAFTITPDPCFWIDKVTSSVDGGDPIPVTEYVIIDPATGKGTYTVTIGSNTVIGVTFKQLGPYTVTSLVKPGADGLPHGTILPDGETEVECRSDLEITMEPDKCYVLDEIIVTREGGAPESVTEDVVEIENPDGEIISYFYILHDIMSDCRVEVTFKKLGPFYINATAGPGGKIEPGGAEIPVECGEDKTFTITADDGYRLDTILIDGEDTPPLSAWTSNPSFDYTFHNVMDHHTIHVTFAKFFLVESDVQPEADGSKHGAISPGGTTSASDGESILFSITPDNCSEIADVLVTRGNGEAVSAMGTIGAVIIDSITGEGIYVLADIQTDCSVEVIFRLLGPFTITVKSSGFGSISHTQDGEVFRTDGTFEVEVGCGGGWIFSKIRAYDCYRIKDVKLDGKSQGAKEELIFSNVIKDHTVEVIFEALGPFTITATVEEGGGTITPTGDDEGKLRVECGEDREYTIVPDTCQEIVDVMVDGESVMGDVNIITPITGTGKYTFRDVREDHILEVFFWTKYQIATVKQNPGGKIEPPGAAGRLEIKCDSDQEFTITPDECYRIKDVKVNGEEVAVSINSTTGVGRYTRRQVTEDFVIEATFEEVEFYTIEASVNDPEGGTIAPVGKVKVLCGRSKVFFIEIIPPLLGGCYEIDRVEVDGKPVELEMVPGVGVVGKDTYSYTFAKVLKDQNIKVFFKKLGPFTITGVALPNGTVVPKDPVKVECGEDKTLTITPEDCWEIEWIDIDDVEIDMDTNPFFKVLDEKTGRAQYIFENVMQDHKVTVKFKKIKYNIVANPVVPAGVPAPGGIVTPGTDILVDCGDDITFRFTPNPGYRIAGIYLEKRLVGVGNSYTFNNVRSDQTLNILFVPFNSASLVAMAAKGGKIAPSGNIGAHTGTNQKFEITADEGYRIEDVQVNGESLGPVPEYTFEDLAGDQTIFVTFIPDVIMGDINDDGRVGSNDALSGLLFIVGLVTLTESQQAAADMNGDGKVGVDDIVLILGAAAGNAAPGTGIIASADRQVRIALDSVYGTAGETVIVPVRVDNGELLAGGKVSIAYDSSVLRAVGVSSKTGAMLVSNVAQPGIVRIAFVSTNGLRGKALAEVQFQVLANDKSPLTFKNVDLYRPDALPLHSREVNGKFESWSIPPERSALLQNFPNPFNPETWIPYQLRTGSEVTIRIYSASGGMVRELDMGYRAAGLYVSKDRAAYWDGRNVSGEKVASGTYFYSIRSGDFSAVRKMIVLQ